MIEPAPSHDIASCDWRAPELHIAYDKHEDAVRDASSLTHNLNLIRQPWFLTQNSAFAAPDDDLIRVSA